MLEKIFALISRHKFSLDTEDHLKLQIAEVLMKNNVPYKKEHILDVKNVIDFFCEGIGIEAKIRTGETAKKIYKQCQRYCQFDEVQQLILVTNKALGFPPEINGKPCYVINLGRSWL